MKLCIQQSKDDHVQYKFFTSWHKATGISENNAYTIYDNTQSKIFNRLDWTLLKYDAWIFRIALGFTESEIITMLAQNVYFEKR